LPDSSEKISVVDILCQIFGYLVINNLQYGVLSTYNQTWFLQRPNNMPCALDISPTINVQSQWLTLFQCYAFMQHLARIDPYSLNSGITPPPSPSSFDNYESSDNNVDSGSDHEVFNFKTKTKMKI
jgi:hypothetical protein